YLRTCSSPKTHYCTLTIRGETTIFRGRTEDLAARTGHHYRKNKEELKRCKEYQDCCVKNNHKLFTNSLMAGMNIRETGVKMAFQLYMQLSQ
ncbi:hypothetical protein E3U43_017470, partial [Larimichthys crocea]